jgi:hypothetical protein
MGGVTCKVLWLKSGTMATTSVEVTDVPPATHDMNLPLNGGSVQFGTPEEMWVLIPLLKLDDGQSGVGSHHICLYKCQASESSVKASMAGSKNKGYALP